jgi:hypothetical protein
MNADKTKLVRGLMIGAWAGVGIAWFVRWYSRKTSALAIFERFFTRSYGPVKAHRFAVSIAQHYAALLSQQPLPQNPALKRHLTGNIFPGLALYQVLLQEYNGDRQAALAETDQAFRAWTLAKGGLLLVPMEFLPTPFWLFKRVFSLRMKEFPAGGWDFQFVENSGDRIAFNATRCFYLNTLTTFGAPELTPSFCKVDDVMAEMMPPSVRFVRPHTLGRGDEICDFQYCRVK